jgi:hypothetical protein
MAIGVIIARNAPISSSLRPLSRHLASTMMVPKTMTMSAIAMDPQETRLRLKDKTKALKQMSMK